MHFGWWDIDVESLRLTNRRTGQMLSCSGDVAGNDGLGLVSTPNLQWMRFDYSDSELSFPLLIQRRNVRDHHGWRGNIWRVDYLRSLRLWAKEGGATEQPPPFGIWQRVDECIRDALCCWPKSQASGPRPDKVALEGGWSNGAWSATLYRSTSTVSDQDLDVQMEPAVEPWLPALNDLAPSPWRLVDESGGGRIDALADWGFQGNAEGKLYLPSGRALPEIELPHLVKEDGSATLIPIAVRLAPGYQPASNWPQFLVRLLYIDSELVCDAFEIRNHFVTAADAAAVEWRVSADYVGGKTGALDRATGQSLVVLRETPRSRAFSEHVGTRVHHRNLTSDGLIRRLNTAFSEALLAWEARTFRLPDAETGELREVTLPRGALVNGCGPMVAGVPDVTVRQNTAAQLHPNAAGVPHPMKFMFEEDDGILRTAMRTEYLGWWDFDPESTALVNRMSEQRLVFAGRFEAPRGMAVPDPGERPWYRFDYRDRVTTFPVLVRRAQPAPNRPLHGAWEIDYNLSNKLWCRESGKSQNSPSYGLWRRLQDCARDALMCWPELEATGEAAGDVASTGGWVNGAWAAFLDTRWHCQPMKRREAWAQEPRPPYFGSAETPLLEPLRAAAPPAWRFCDAPVAQRGARIDGLSIARKAGRLSLPDGSPLQGFENHIPFVRRDDGQAVMFPHDLHSDLYRGEDYRVQPEMLYADADVLALLCAGWAEANLTHGILARGLRGSATIDPEGLWRTIDATGARRPLLYPSLRLYRSLFQNLCDAWLAWRGCDKRVLDDPAYIEKINQRNWFKTPYEQSGFSLGRPSSVKIEGSYLGGLYFPWSTQTFTLRTAAEKATQDDIAAKVKAELQNVIGRMQASVRGRFRGKH